MWDLPGPELKPVSPALAGGFLTTAPPGKSQKIPDFSYFIISNKFLTSHLLGPPGCQPLRDVKQDGGLGGWG